MKRRVNSSRTDITPAQLSSKTPPKVRNCGTLAVHNRLLEAFPAFRVRQHELEHAAQAGGAASLSEAVSRIVKIPIVVHVVYSKTSENISMAQIKSQIVSLNRDYRATNPDKSLVPAPWKGMVTDAKIEFALASKDPKGKRTTGVTRTQTTVAEFQDDDSVKSSSMGGANPWPTSKYLNIWVCTLGNNLLGYAQFPGGPAPTDGVVILNTAFGTTGTAAAPFNKGRTATHEIGHWLNLRHIWGDTPDCSGGDGVHDTPNAEGPNFGRPTFPHITCNNGPSGDMFVNYMDYVDDAAMMMFTPQQVLRIRTTLTGARKSLGT